MALQGKSSTLGIAADPTVGSGLDTDAPDSAEKSAKKID
jgi:hypothetical protein